MLGYWPYATHKKIFFLFFRHIYICNISWKKLGILIPDLYFYNIKKITNHKLNTRENQRYYLFFLGWVQLGPCG
jgi:hypothetical protein